MVDLSPGRQSRREGLLIVSGGCLEDLDDRAVLLGVVEEFERAVHVVGTEDDIDVARTIHDRVAVFLGETATDGNLHVGVLFFQHLEVTESAVELVVGILTDATGVEDDHVGIGDVVDAVHPVGLEQTGDPLRVVLVHLTAVRLDNVGLALTAHGGVVHLIGHASEVTDSSTQAVVRSVTESSATG